MCRKLCRVGWGCTPFHHCPLHPFIITAEQLRNSFFLSLKLQKKGSTWGARLPHSPAELCWQSQACPGSSFSRTVMDLCRSSFSPVKRATGSWSIPLQTLEVSHAASEDLLAIWVSPHPSSLAGHQVITSDTKRPPWGCFTTEPGVPGHSCFLQLHEVMLHQRIWHTGEPWGVQGFKWTMQLVCSHTHTHTLQFKATSSASLSLHLLSCTMGVTTMPKSQVNLQINWNNTVTTGQGKGIQWFICLLQMTTEPVKCSHHDKGHLLTSPRDTANPSLEPSLLCLPSNKPTPTSRQLSFPSG